MKRTILKGKVFDFQLLELESLMSDLADDLITPKAHEKKLDTKSWAFKELLAYIQELIKSNGIKRVDSESSLDEFLGISDSKEIELSLQLEDWNTLNTLASIQTYLDNIKDSNQPDDWIPPENWAFGTDDEIEAYNEFWKSKNKQ